MHWFEVTSVSPYNVSTGSDQFVWTWCRENHCRFPGCRGLVAYNIILSQRWYIIGSFWLLLPCLLNAEQNLTVFSMSPLMFGQYTHSLVRALHFWIPRWPSWISCTQNRTALGSRYNQSVSHKQQILSHVNFITKILVLTDIFGNFSDVVRPSTLKNL